MPLSKSKGNMYEWVTHMHTHLRGACPHKCPYCYVKTCPAGRMGHYKGELRLEERELSVNLGSGKTIFLEHMNDLFADGVKDEWIEAILNHALLFPNRYVIQTKNPERIGGFLHLIPDNSIIGTTIETNRPIEGCAAPSAKSRARGVWCMPSFFETFVTIEPIMAFDLDEMVELIRTASPDWVNIGADSKRNGLPEPAWDEVMALVERLSVFTTIRNKSNLERLKGR